MKTLFSFFATCILGMYVHAQTVQLRDYKAGEQINDTIYKHYGMLGSSGIGKIYFKGDIISELLTGVSFKMVIDSVNNGDSPVNPARATVNGQSVSLKKKDTLALPADFQLYAGKIGFHVLIHGKPITVNQEYFCGLNLIFTTGADFEMYITEELTEEADMVCTVGLATGLKRKTYNKSVSVYPNPVTSEVTINGSAEMIGLAYSISNAMGTVVKSGNIENELSVVAISHLLPGVYYVTVESTAPVKIIKQ